MSSLPTLVLTPKLRRVGCYIDHKNKKKLLLLYYHLIEHTLERTVYAIELQLRADTLLKARMVDYGGVIECVTDCKRKETNEGDLYRCEFFAKKGIRVVLVSAFADNPEESIIFLDVHFK